MDINEMAEAAMGMAMFDSYRRTMEKHTVANDGNAAAPPKNWYAILNGSQAGPFTLGEMSAMVRSGSITVGSYVWREGMPDWLPAESVPELGLERTVE